MSREILASGSLVVCTFVLSAALADRSDQAHGDQPRKTDQTAIDQVGGRKQPKTAQLSLDTVYSTMGGKGTKRMPRADEPGGREVEQLESSLRLGASTIFLVRAEGIASGLSGMVDVMVGGRSATRVHLLPKKARGRESWLVAYLGISDSGGEWLLRSVQQTGKQLRVNYFEPERIDRTADRVLYYCLVALGEIDTGEWTLELCNSDTNKVTLTRTVQVIDD